VVEAHCEMDADGGFVGERDAPDADYLGSNFAAIVFDGSSMWA
jgi:hypothetical protein